MSQRTLVIYHYFEKDVSYIENFFHFLAIGYSARLDYLVIIAGDYTIELPRRHNLRYLFSENRNNDFGGYADAIERSIDPLAHDYFVFINSSVRGPYTAGCDERCWTRKLIDLIDSDRQVGLVGSSINILSAVSRESIAYQQKYGGSAPFSHVQTMCYAMPQKSLLYLCVNGFFKSDIVLAKNEVIRDYEIRLSQMILAGGWNIKCLLPEYNLIDYRLPHGDINPNSAHGDANCAFGYFGRSAHPFEVMFVKSNRNLFSTDYLNRLSYSCYKKQRVQPAMFANRHFERYIRTLEAGARSSARIEFGVRNPSLKFIPKFLRPLLINANRRLG